MLETSIKNLPSKPGVYIMYNKNNEVIYVGKAKNLKNRVSQYFRNSSSHSVKVKAMVKNIERFEYIITKTEFEALTLECNLIKFNMPKYNVLLKDDKAHPYIKVTVNEKYPRILLARRVLNDGARYFGPYQSSNIIYSIIDNLKQIFKIRSCNSNITGNAQRTCLNYQIGKCSGPCSGNVDVKTYNYNVEQAILFLEGKNDDVFVKLQKEMEEASKNLQFEKAAEIRDKLLSIKTIREKQDAVNVNLENADIIACDRSGINVSFVVLMLRNGKIVSKNFYFVKDEINNAIEIVFQEFMKQYYAMQSAIPKNIFIQYEIPDHDLIANWLKVNIKVPKRGEKLKYVNMALQNAREQLKLKLLNDDINSKKLSDIMFELKDMLKLKEVPEIIEAYDISHTGGDNNVGVMVSFKNGKPNKSMYRKFNIRSVVSQDDYGSLREVLYRRLSNGINGEKGFTPLPDLILLDGGAGQLSAVMEVVEFLNADIPLFGVVKDDKHKTRAVVGTDGEVSISPTSSVYKFLYTIQEEVHRFAISFHRKKRSKSMVNSVLLEISGIGPAKQKALLKHFKSLKNIKDADTKQLKEVKGITDKNATDIYNKFHN
ncbi:MAG: excinuclease ABC subunit UvrC [Clostridia bacterium]|nr:excinuclease ABC subunit UvrC [Clostridia bacterium]